jgi:hypothetical protein
MRNPEQIRSAGTMAPARDALNPLPVGDVYWLWGDG